MRAMREAGISGAGDCSVLARPKAVDLGASKLFPCKSCLRPFARRNSFHVCCSPACGIQHARSLNAKRDEKKRKLERKLARRELRAFRVRTKTLPKLKSEAQHEFNRFIRERDHDQPCISCDTTAPPERFGGAWDCGHFRTVAAAGHLRFSEQNASRQCKTCNGGRTNFTGKEDTVRRAYKVRLIEKLGVAAVEALEADNTVKRWAREELIEIRRTYLAKWKALKAARESAMMAS